MSDRDEEFEKRIAALEERASKNSIRVGTESQSNMSQDAAIGLLVVDVKAIKDELKKNTALSVELKQLFLDTAKNPKVQAFLAVLLLCAGAAAEWARHWFETHGGP